MREMIHSICREIELTQHFFSNKKIDTIYFGGGTPGMIGAELLNEIIQKLNQHYDFTNLREVTVECNPDDITPDFLKKLKNDSPVNRISLGIQSFHDAHLKWMNRSHGSKQAFAALEQISNSGINHLSIDLIYGLPDNLPDYWSENIDLALSFNIPHLSAYALTVEPKTALHHFIKENKTTAPSDETAAQDFETLRLKMLEKGYHHYEISNFSKTGHESLHNSGYWEGMFYLGLGPGAHSYRNNERSWNVSNNMQYLKKIESGELPKTIEHLNQEDHYNEFLMIHLRKTNGFLLNKMAEKLKTEDVAFFLTEVQPLIKTGKIIHAENRFKIHPDKLFTADQIISTLFKV